MDGLAIEETPDNALESEKNGREQNQERDQLFENHVAGARQQERSNDAADDANRNKPPQPLSYRRQMAAIAKEASGRSNHEGQGARGVGNDSGCAKKEQGREGYECSTAGNSIDSATGGGGDGEEYRFGPGHDGPRGYMSYMGYKS